MKAVLVALLIASMLLIPADADGEKEQLLEQGDSQNLRYGRCSTTCPAVWQPVCASNNRCIRTFNNSCLLRQQNCRSTPNQRYNIIPIHYCKNVKPCQ